MTLRILLLSLIAAWPTVQTVAHAQPEPGIRAELAEPMQRAQQLAQSGRGAQALKMLEGIEAGQRLNDYELYILARLRGAAAVTADQPALAIAAYRSALASPWLDAGERPALLAAVARLSYTTANYGEAADLIQQYLRAGGADATTTGLYAQALYMAGRHGEAADWLRREIAAIEEVGGRPSERSLQLLVNCALGMNDNAGYVEAMRQLVSHYPKADYWQTLIGLVTSAPTFSDRYALDVYRLRRHTGTLRGVEDYMEPAQLALRYGFPVEAEAFLALGYAAGVLGQGGEAEVTRQSRLQNHAIRRVSEDRETLAEAADTRQQTPDMLFSNGYNFITFGDFDTGLKMMRTALDRGGLAYPEAARMRYGYALLQAGRRDEALAVWRRVRGDDGAQAMAQLWIAALQHDHP